MHANCVIFEHRTNDVDKMSCICIGIEEKLLYTILDTPNDIIRITKMCETVFDIMLRFDRAKREMINAIGTME